MSTQSNHILQQALSLPEAERADLAASLFLSLDTKSDPDADKLWAAEIQDRINSIDSGNVTLVPWSELKAEMSSRRRN